MPSSEVAKKKSNPLTPHWLFCLCLLSLLIVYNLACHLWLGSSVLHWPEPQRELVRSILYLMTIILFPLTKLIRHVLLRLNQTMPGEKSASQRYFFTIIVTQSLLESVSLFGLLMFILGDDFNTLYIFSVLGLLGIYLHRPDSEEYTDIVRALSAKNS